MQNLKRQQLDEERYSSIERANYLLLERMSHIMTHPQTVDMKQALPPPKSLNKDGRKKELMRITEENHNILRRIQVLLPAAAVFSFLCKKLHSNRGLMLDSSAQRALLLSTRMDGGSTASRGSSAEYLRVSSSHRLVSSALHRQNISTSPSAGQRGQVVSSRQFSARWLHWPSAQTAQLSRARR